MVHYLHYACTSIAILIAATYTFWSMWVIGNIAYTRKNRAIYLLAFMVSGVLGLLLDVLFQVTFATILFLELPHETTVSRRLTRYLSTFGPKGKPPKSRLEKWRLNGGLWIATNLVEPWAPGHIGLVRLGFPPAVDLVDSLTKCYPNAVVQFLAMMILALSAAAIDYSLLIHN